MRKIYLYAGYYELHISAHKLSHLYVPISWHKSLRAALDKAHKVDPDAPIIAYKDTVKDFIEYFGADITDSLVIA